MIFIDALVKGLLAGLIIVIPYIGYKEKLSITGWLKLGCVEIAFILAYLETFGIHVLKLLN